MDDDILSEEDLQNWYYVTETVSPMPGKNIFKSDLKENPIYDVGDNHLSKNQTKPTKKQKKYHSYLQHGDTSLVDGSTAKKLTGGKFKIEAKLDLHGRTQNEAIEDLRYFVNSSFELGKRNILVITGKGVEGGGILKNNVPLWLNLVGIRERVLMFSYAHKKHGGEGALYVLLKKNK